MVSPDANALFHILCSKVNTMQHYINRHIQVGRQQTDFDSSGLINCKFTKLQLRCDVPSTLLLRSTYSQKSPIENNIFGLSSLIYITDLRDVSLSYHYARTHLTGNYSQISIISATANIRYD